MQLQTKFSKLIFIFCLIIFIIEIINVPTIQNSKAVAIYSFKMFETALMMFIAFVPIILRQLFCFNIPSSIENAAVAFCFTALILGDVANFYGLFAWWDIILHAISGILIGITGYEIISASNVIFEGKPRYTPFFVLVWVISFSLAAGTFWEIMEFITDGLLGLNSQEFLISSGTFDEAVPRVGRDALYDTMCDLILDFIGATSVAIYGYFDIQRKGIAYNQETKSEICKMNEM